MAQTKKSTKKRMGAKKRAGPNTKASKKLSTSAKAHNKVRKVMREYKQGKLHSRSKKGPTVRSRRQAIAIALNEAGASSRKRSSKKKAAKKRISR